MATLNIDHGWHFSVTPSERIRLGLQNHEIQGADKPLYFIFATGSYITSFPHGKDRGSVAISIFRTRILLLARAECGLLLTDVLSFVSATFFFFFFSLFSIYHTDN